MIVTVCFVNARFLRLNAMDEFCKWLPNALVDINKRHS